MSYTEKQAGEVEFATKRHIINLLDVKVKLAVFDGQQLLTLRVL